MGSCFFELIGTLLGEEGEEGETSEETKMASRKVIPSGGRVVEVEGRGTEEGIGVVEERVESNRLSNSNSNKLAG